ncbi:MAG: metal-dependent hydrolase [Akkermansia sp.]|nr:metal-dependent hydrolase [Akkermansia sp.]
MFIAHIPAGYLAARGAERCGIKHRLLMAACLLGSITPDIDLLYFYLVDACRHHHHSYFIHWPIVWLGLLLLSLLWLLWKRGGAAVPAVAFSAAGLLHVALDGVVGDIQLFAPWSDEYYALATVPARYQPWWLNFFLHWSMGIELLICAVATWLFLLRLRKKS